MTPSERRPPGELHEWVNAELTLAAELSAEAVDHARVAADLRKKAAKLREQATAARHARRLDEREAIADEREKVADQREEHAAWRDQTADLCEQTLEELRRSMRDPATAATLRDSSTADITDAIAQEVERLHARLAHGQRLLRLHNIDPPEAPAD
ncbi:hypothetical protein ABN028_18145 [Actinopolymorpha sp. B17G11]|uniref:hypothetical protein n=1 Tax=Actinopolymorpha sp. B17G11 TaxID=3160861 RepID=UPI0032E49C84